MESRIQQDLVTAMKAKDTVRLASLRSIKAAISVARTSPNAPENLTDADIQQIIQKLVKQRKDSAEQYSAAGRTDLADNELAEMVIMEEYLPKQLSDTEIKEIINKLLLSAESSFNMGGIMKYFKENYSGQYDGKKVSNIAKDLLK